MFTATDWIRDKNGLMVLTPFPSKMGGDEPQNKYIINFGKKIQETLPRAGLSYRGKALS